MIAERVLKEVNARLGFLLDVGLDYLSLDRRQRTLAGGEAQRHPAGHARSARPGRRPLRARRALHRLHQRDNRRLIETLLRLKRLGNTSSSSSTTRTPSAWPTGSSTSARRRRARRPGRGQRPGQRAAGLRGLHHGAYLSGPPVDRRARRPPPAHARRELKVVGAASTTCATSRPLPARQLVAVTGVSGSGKSTLVNDILATVLVKQLNGGREVPGRHKRVEGSSTSTRSCGSTSRRSGARRGRTRPPTPACSTTCASCSPRPPRPRSAATCRAGSPSTSRAGAARRAPATARSRSR
jgi:excinuclease ABC subunit A